MLCLKELLLAIHLEAHYTLWNLYVKVNNFEGTELIDELDESGRKELFNKTHTLLVCDEYRRLCTQSSFLRIDSTELLSMYFDELIPLIRTVHKKHIGRGSNATLMIQQITLFCTSEFGNILVHFDNESKVDGFGIALVVPSEPTREGWIEFNAMCLKPGIMKHILAEGKEIIKKWAFERFHVDKMYIMVTRPSRRGMPDALAKIYEQYGFKKIGYVMEG